MMYICHDCGYQIPEDMDFCPRCGCMRDKAMTLDDQGRVGTACPSCGAAVGPGDLFCGACGSRLPEQPQVVMPTQRKNGMLALMLALLPGFFNVFGLGHLVMRQWARGAMFLVITLVIWYVNGWSVFSANLVMTFMTVMVYMYQALDIFKVIYTPEAK